MSQAVLKRRASTSVIAAKAALLSAAKSMARRERLLPQRKHGQRFFFAAPQAAKRSRQRLLNRRTIKTAMRFTVFRTANTKLSPGMIGWMESMAWIRRRVVSLLEEPM